MEFLESFFDGLGTEIIILVIGIISGGVAGYKIGVKNGCNQKQSAGRNSKQQQLNSIKVDFQNGEKSSSENKISQTQKAGKCSEQIQIGGNSNGKQ